MIHSLESFRYKGMPIQVLGDYINPLFIAKEVCNALGLKDTESAIRKLDADEKGTQILRTPGGNQTMIVINEPGLYSLVLRSTKPEAKAFKRWITHEILPSIRKQGFYGVPTAIKKRVKLEMAKERLTEYIVGSSIWDEATVERFIQINKHLTNPELARVFGCSQYSISHLKMLLRHATGDFTDKRPLHFQPEATQLALVENIGKVTASEEVQRSIWRLKVIDGRTYNEIANATGYSMSACRNFVEKQQLVMEINHG